ncbi:MAG: T9SS type A sorting domain-containing protein, partial [Nonlabens sp.]
ASTPYDVYIRADCGNGDFSDWTGPFSFDTACEVITPDYAETFDTFIPTCWSEAQDGDLATGPDPSTSTSSWLADGFGNNGTTGSARYEIWLTGDVAWLITPEFDLSAGGYEADFDVALTVWNTTAAATINSDDQVQFLISENGGAWSELVVWDENNSPSPTGDDVNVPLTSTSTNVRFAFLVTEGPTTGGDFNFYVDNFQVRTPPSCFGITNLVVNNTTTTTADITFDSGNTNSNGNFEYIVVPANDPAPTGAGTPISDAAVTNGTYAFTIGDGSTTGPALAPSSSYDLYVREVCAAGDESGYNLVGVQFNTQCAPIAAPYFTDFENFVADTEFVTQNCWTQNLPNNFEWQIDAVGGTVSGSTGPSGAFSGTTFMYSEASLPAANGDIAIVDSPAIDLSTLSTPELSFYYHMYGETIVSLTTEVSIDGGATYTQVDQLLGEQQSANGDPWLLRRVDLSAFANEIVIVRFLSEINENAVGDAFYGDVAIDDFRIDNVPSCFEPSGLAVSNITSTTADISFDTGNSTSNGNFEFVLVPANDPAPTGAGTAISDTTVTNGSYTFSLGNGTTTGPALSPQTSYDVYVREICGAGDESDYVGPVTFETACLAVSTFPVVEDMSNHLPSTCWNEAGDGEIGDGPMSLGASDWRGGRAYTDSNGNVIPSNVMNIWQLNTDREWLISEEYDLSGQGQLYLNVQVAVTNYSGTGTSDATDTDTMDVDDSVDLLVTTNGGTSWTSLTQWNASNQPDVTGTDFSVDLSTYTGTAQFAFLASDGVLDPGQDYDFHVGAFAIESTPTASNGSVDVVTNITLYPNPVSGDILNLEMGGLNSGKVSVSIHNALGQLVRSESVESSNMIELTGMSELSNGMYFITVGTADHKQTIKFLKE